VYKLLAFCVCEKINKTKKPKTLRSYWSLGLDFIRSSCKDYSVERPQINRGVKMSGRKLTSLSITAGTRLGSTYMGDGTVIDLDINTHLRNVGELEVGGIISTISQHLTLADAKEIVALLNVAIAEIELETL
jgi:hypothetical protein